MGFRMWDVGRNDCGCKARNLNDLFNVWDSQSSAGREF